MKQLSNLGFSGKPPTQSYEFPQAVHKFTVSADGLSNIIASWLPAHASSWASIISKIFSRDEQYMFQGDKMQTICLLCMFALYTLYSILYTLYSILYTLYSILYTLYSIPTWYMLLVLKFTLPVPCQHPSDLES